MSNVNEWIRNGDHEKTNGTRQTEKARRTTSSEIATEQTLPDYRPEIRRILKVTAEVHPEGCFIGGTSAELSGTVDFAVLYSDGDGRLNMISFTEEYSIDTPIDDGVNTVLYDVIAESVSARATGPRKINAKCKLRARILALGEEDCSCSVIGAEEESTERLFGECASCRVIRGESERLSLEEDIMLDSPALTSLADESEIRIILPEAWVFIKEVSSVDDGIFCRGDATIKLLLCREEPEGEPYVVQRSIPFETRVSADGVSTGDPCRAFGKVYNISVANEDGHFACRLDVVITAEAQKSLVHTYVKDIYSSNGCQCLVDRRDVEILAPVACIQGNLTCSETFSLEEMGAEEGSLPVDVSGSAIISDVRTEDGRLCLAGEGRYTVLLSHGGEYYTRDCSRPFKFKTDIRTEYESESLDLDGVALPVLLRCRGDNEKYQIDCELSISARVGTKGLVNSVVEAEILPKESTEGEREMGGYLICYPDRKDSLWSVGKRYGRSVADICAKNGIKTTLPVDSTETLSGVGFLIV